MFSTFDTDFLPMRRLVQLVALSLALSPVAATAEATVEELTNPDTTQFSFGLGYNDADGQRYRMYNDLEEDHGYAIGSINFIRRTDETGVWTRIFGRNLGLDTAEFAAEYERQGDWRIAVDYSRTPRVTPYEVHTNLQGIGSNNLTYPANAGNTVQPASTSAGIELETIREKTRLEVSRYFSPEIEARLLFQHEQKQGERLFGRGTSSQQEFLAEPIDYLTRQLDAAVNYTGERLQLSAGYYGSFFSNADKAINITGGAGNLNPATAPFTPISLPLDNSAHQFSLMGAYQFTPSTRGNFKIAHTRNIQDDDFMAVGSNCALFDGSTNCNISGRDDLGGRMDTTLVDLGLTSRPIPKLNLVAKLRYEDRDDKTTIAQYINPKSSSQGTTDGFNEQRSLTIESGKLEATYQLPQGFSLNGGVEAERKDRNMDGVRVVGYRSRVEEMTYRLGLRRSMADTLTGSWGYERSDRTGTDFQALRKWNTQNSDTPTDDTWGDPYVLGGLLQPIYMADRNRDKTKLALDWMPTDALSFQFNAEKTWDDYETGRQDPAEIGVRNGDSWLINVDATYIVSDNWKLSAWLSRNVTNLDQASCRNSNSTDLCAANTWNAGLTSRSDAVGLAMRGKVFSKVNIGADLTYMRDHNDYDKSFTSTLETALSTPVVPANATTDANNQAALADLPSITSYMTTLKLFANYPVGKESSIQLDYKLDHRKTNDWTWEDWRYTDGTWLEQDPNETVHFLGVSFRYGFR